MNKTELGFITFSRDIDLLFIAMSHAKECTVSIMVYNIQIFDKLENLRSSHSGQFLSGKTVA